MATREKLLCSKLFPHVLEFAQSDYTRRGSTALGDIRTLFFQGLIGYSSIYLWLKYVISTAPLTLMRTSYG